MVKFLENLREAEKILRTVDHLFYVTFPLINDKKLLLKILLETRTAIIQCINSVLHREYILKRISLHEDPKINLKTFDNKCASRYNITEEEKKLIFELFNFLEKHEQSSFEFLKDGKLVILSDGLEPDVFTIERTKNFLQLGKDVLRKIQNAII